MVCTFLKVYMELGSNFLFLQEQIKATIIKPLSWLGTIRPTSANCAFNPELWSTFVSMTLGLEVPVLSSLPCLNNSLFAKCGCKKHYMDFHVHPTATCTAH
jgi:hypothetical protein